MRRSRMKSVIKTNIKMFIGLIIIAVLIIPLGTLYLLVLALYKMSLVILIPVMFFCGMNVFMKVKNDDDADGILLFMGAIGGFIAALTVNKEYIYKEKIYNTFSKVIWRFLVYPLVIFLILVNSNYFWVPSV